MNIQTTIRFDASCDILAIANDGKDVGLAGYKARVWFGDDQNGNNTEQPTMSLPPTASELTVTAAEGTHVTVLIAAVNREGVKSPATPFSFIASKIVPPRRPTNVHVCEIKKITSLPQASPAPATPIQLNVTDHGEDTINVMVNGHSAIKDGAIGTVVGQKGSQVEAIFPASALKEDTGTPTATYLLDANDATYSVVILMADQSTVPLKDFVEMSVT